MPAPLKRARAKKRTDVRRRKTAAPTTPRDPATAALTTTAPSRGQIEAVKRLFDNIPDDELTAALESTDDERAQRLLAILRDDAYRTSGMALKIRAAGLTVAEALSSITAMYHSDAGLRVARRIPGILERMAVECEPHRVPCPKCASGDADLDTADSVATTLDGVADKCGRCRGKRSILVPGDNEVRKLVLDNQNLSGSKAPLIDARSVHVHNAPDMTAWSRESDGALEKALPRRLAAGLVIDTTTVGER